MKHTKPLIDLSGPWKVVTTADPDQPSTMYVSKEGDVASEIGYPGESFAMKIRDRTDDSFTMEGMGYSDGSKVWVFGSFNIVNDHQVEGWYILEGEPRQTEVWTR